MTFLRPAVVPVVISRLSEIWPSIEARARSQGAVRVGASSLQDAHAFLFEQWLDRGHHGSMKYLQKNRDTRLRPQERYPWANSVIVVAVPYSPDRSATPGSLGAHTARYALGDDYHVVLDIFLRDLEEGIRELAPQAQTRRYVDTGPMSDRAFAAQAGLGWIGKNGMLIDPEHGSWVFIATLLTSLQNDIVAEEIADRCGTCTRCLESCPTHAILPDRTVNSKACISYATIEHRGPIDDRVKPMLSGNVFGCDICNEVCPWNHAPASAAKPFSQREEYRAMPVSDLLRVSQADFSRLFRNSAIKRAKRAGMIRNAILTADQIPPEIERQLCAEEDEGIQDALAWRRRVSG
jgi:epoxyqueuosine reductase